MDLLLRRGCAGCARYVVTFRRTHDVTGPVRVFNMLNFACVERSSQPSAYGATDAANGRADMSSAVYCRKLFARKVQWTHCVTKRHLYRTNGEFAFTLELRRNLVGSVDELMTSATMLSSGRASAPRRCYVEAALRSCRVERRRENVGATIVTMTQLQWISRISYQLVARRLHGHI